MKPENNQTLVDKARSIWFLSPWSAEWGYLCVVNEVYILNFVPTLGILFYFWNPNTELVIFFILPSFL